MYLSEIDDILHRAQYRLSELAYGLAVDDEYGVWDNKKYAVARKIRYIIKLLTERGHLMSDIQKERFLGCLVDISELYNYPTVPIIMQARPNIVLNKTLTVTNNLKGKDGTDANIVCQLDVGEDELRITETFINGVKTYRFKIDRYTPPEVGLWASEDITGRTAFEIGEVVNIRVMRSIVMGRDPLVIKSYTSPPSIAGQTSDNLLDSNVLITGQRSYATHVLDGTTSIVKSVVINGYHPFLYGASNNSSINHYTLDGKLLQPKSTKSVVFNGVDKFFWFGYPAEYGDLARITDGVDDVTALFTKVTPSVTSSGLNQNWTRDYIFYRTTFITDITNKQYTFVFS